jgi:hypothetical protein
MNDDVLHPAGPARRPPDPRRRRVWPWVLLGLFVLVTMLVVLAIVGAVATIDEWGGGSSVSISVGGETHVLPTPRGGALVAMLFGVAVALALALVLVPLLLLAAVVAVGVALAFALVAAAVTAALAASPLLLVAALVWWAVRAARKAPAAAAAPPSSSA